MLTGLLLSASLAVNPLPALAGPGHFHGHQEAPFSQIESDRLLDRSTARGRYDTARFTLRMSSLPHEAGSSSEYLRSNQDRLAKLALSTLDDTYDELSRIFRLNPPGKVTLNYMAPDEFSRKTGAPAWTNAMYFRGQISIPLTTSNLRSGKDLVKAIKHEYVHAFLGEITRHKCPAWLDEGLAQLLEGKPNSILGPALRNWIRSNRAIKLDRLQHGFTTLNSEMVPAAYAQSLFATRSLVNRYGFSGMRDYLLALGKGGDPKAAFQTAFGISEAKFEASLDKQIRAWSRTGKRHP